jgi:hypothetical protein
LNLPEEQRAAEAIARILRYGAKEDIDENSSTESPSMPEESPLEPEIPEETPPET